MSHPARSWIACLRFFDARLAALEAAGVARSRLILDPGMGFFLGTDPQTSLTVLRRLPQLKARYGLPLLVSVSRKSFLQRLTGRDGERYSGGAASLAAELFAIRQGADYIRTHAPAARSRTRFYWKGWIARRLFKQRSRRRNPLTIVALTGRREC